MWWRNSAGTASAAADRTGPDGHPPAVSAALRALATGGGALETGRTMRWSTAAAVTAVTALSAGAAALAAGRYVSDLALRPPDDGPPGTAPLTVHSTAAGRITVSRTTASSRPGCYALTGPGRHAVVGEVLATSADSVTRRLERVDGDRLTAGTTVRLTPQVYRGDPRTAHGLDFEEVRIPSDLGPLPGWFLPGLRTTWVITVHGLGATREQPLAVLPQLRAFALPVLDIAYRNDPGAPRAPDRLCHFGETEWRDLDAAIRFAVRRGADQLVLHGWSTGATMALYAAQRSPLRGAVRGLVLDSPVLDWRTSLRRQVAGHRVPGPLLPLGVRAVEGRTGLRGDGWTEAARPEALTVPTLILHGPDDSVAPWGPSRELARNRPDLVILHTVREADHAAMWNADPAGYGEALRRFLTPLV